MTKILFFALAISLTPTCVEAAAGTGCTCTDAAGNAAGTAAADRADGAAATTANCDTTGAADCGTGTCNANYVETADATTATIIACVATCTCPNGVQTVGTGSGATLCETPQPDCSACTSEAGYVITAAAGTGAQTCVANTCTCTNGVAATDARCNVVGSTIGHEICASCNTGYHLTNAGRCEANICTCSTGTAATGTSCLHHGVEMCQSCNTGYGLEDSCQVNTCTCVNGKSATGTDCTTHGLMKCATRTNAQGNTERDCNDGYVELTGTDGVCQATCKAHQCRDGYEVKTDATQNTIWAANADNWLSDNKCCQAKCSATTVENDCNNIAGGRCAWTAGVCKAVCTHPNAPTGYVKTNAAGTLTMDALAPTGWTCDTGYSNSGSISFTMCDNVGGTYTPTGCEADCTDPGNVAGYTGTYTTGTSAAFHGFTKAGLTCDENAGYFGTVVVTKCSTAGTAWTLSGCEATCTAPTLPTGYSGTLTGVYQTKTDGSRPTGVSCASDYEGTVTYSCGGGVNTAYSLSGCQKKCSAYATQGDCPTARCAWDSSCKDVCKDPTQPAGYSGTVTGTKTIAGFSLTGLSCDTNSGYTGAPVYTVCTTAGGDYTITGCEATCTAPTLPAEGYVGTFAGTLTITGFNPTGVTCADGYVLERTFDVATNKWTQLTEVRTTVCGGANTAFTVGGCEKACSGFTTAATCPTARCRWNSSVFYTDYCQDLVYANDCTCANGVLRNRDDCTRNVTDCTSCDTGYTLRKSCPANNVCSCDNGSPAVGPECTKNNAHICASCKDGYTLQSTGLCKANTCTCNDGPAATGSACAIDGAAICASCNVGYAAADMCQDNKCSCRNGVAKTGVACTKNKNAICDTCNDGYVTLSTGVCQATCKVHDCPEGSELKDTALTEVLPTHDKCCQVKCSTYTTQATCTEARCAWSGSTCEATCTAPGATGGYTGTLGGTLTRTGFAPSGASCDTASFYSGTVSYKVCPNTGGAYTLEGCEAPCTAPTLPTGYTGTLAGDYSTQAFAPTGANCDTDAGYPGTPVYTKCATPGTAFTVSGCKATCKAPATLPTGYAGTLAGDNSMDNFKPTGAACATGYVGTVTYNKCGAANLEYSLSGCKAACSSHDSAGACPTDRCLWVTTDNACKDTCKQPAVPVGYKGTLAGDETMGSFAPTGLECDTGYTGAPVYSVCAEWGTMYTISGCEATCTHPTELPAGYVGTFAGEIKMTAAFAPTGISCATGYVGVVQYTKCDAVNTAYTLSGCQKPCSSFTKIADCPTARCRWFTSDFYVDRCEDFVYDNKCDCANGNAAVSDGLQSTTGCTRNVTDCTGCDAGFMPTKACPASNICSCENGSPAIGVECTTDNAHLCGSCKAGYTLTVEGKCKANTCTCKDGAAATGAACVIDGAEICASCNNGHTSHNDCQAFQCTCVNGVPKLGENCSKNKVAMCDSCNNGYTKLTDGVCQATCQAYTCPSSSDASPLLSERMDTKLALTNPTDEKCCQVKCEGYSTQGTCPSTRCTWSGSTCQASCKAPATLPTGYKGTLGGSLLRSTFAPSGAQCDTASAYTGTVKYTICSNTGGTYTLSGCEAPCKAPALPVGYKGTLAGDVSTGGFSPSGAECDTENGYTGAAVYTKCTVAGGFYTISGCKAQCKHPETLPTGYTGTLGGTITIDGFKPSGASCATGYAGTVVYLPCGAANAEYSMTGCKATCSSFTASNDCPSDRCSWVETVCKDTCKAPSLPVGYKGSLTGTITMGDFNVSGVECNTGYVGSVSYTECSAPGSMYSVSGCEANCTHPATTPPGYIGTANGTTTIKGFDVNGFECAADHVGSVTITPCSAAGEAYSFSGCKAACSTFTKDTECDKTRCAWRAAASVCEARTCGCENGVPMVGQDCLANTTICSSCSAGYQLAASCPANVCVCENGSPAKGPACASHHSHVCGECDGGFKLNNESKCEVETEAVASTEIRGDVTMSVQNKTEFCERNSAGLKATNKAVAETSSVSENLVTSDCQAAAAATRRLSGRRLTDSVVVQYIVSLPASLTGGPTAAQVQSSLTAMTASDLQTLHAKKIQEMVASGEIAADQVAKFTALVSSVAAVTQAVITSTATTTDAAPITTTVTTTTLQAGIDSMARSQTALSVGVLFVLLGLAA